MRYGLLWLLPAMACAGGDANERGVVRDSAGIAVVTNAPTDVIYAVVGDDPLLRLGRADGTGPDVFGRVRTAILLVDGSIAVADAFAREIRVFAEDGRHLRTFGGSGEGPGEFQTLWSIAQRRDSLLALDNLAARISVFASDGTFARSYTIPRIADALAPNVQGWFEDGTALFSATRREPEEGRSDIVLYSVDPDGRITDRLGVFPDQRLGANGMGLGFGSGARVAVGADRIWYANSEAFELRSLDRAGTVRRIIRLGRAPAPVSDADIAEARARVRADLARQQVSGPAVQRILDTEYAARFPVLGALLAAANGDLWVERYRTPLLEPDGPGIWDVFDHDGVLLGCVALPDGFELISVGRAVVLGEHTDDLGVQRIELRSLVRR